MSMLMLHSPVARNHAKPPAPGRYRTLGAMLTISQELWQILLYILHAVSPEGCVFGGGVHVVEYCRTGFGRRTRGREGVLTPHKGWFVCPYGEHEVPFIRWQVGEQLSFLGENV